jgi:hypothetical protein
LGLNETDWPFSTPEPSKRGSKSTEKGIKSTVIRMIQEGASDFQAQHNAAIDNQRPSVGEYGAMVASRTEISRESPSFSGRLEKRIGNRKRQHLFDAGMPTGEMKIAISFPP